jgi:hypothetical protein
MTPVISDPAPYFPTLSPLRRLATPTKMNPTSAKVTPKTWCLTIALFSIYFERIQVEIMVPPESIWLIEAGINRIEKKWDTPNFSPSVSASSFSFLKSF